ncbi:MAG: hypothetical protein AAGA65_31430 [Actinomycetota bacterium]
MTVEARSQTSAPDTRWRFPSQEDPDLVELVDAVVSAVDTDRSWEIERVAAALEPFGGAALFGDELRLNGSGSAECPCRAEGWL